MRRIAGRWGPPLLWAAVIFALSSRPRLPSPEVAGFDKVSHFGAFALLAFLLARALDGPRGGFRAAAVGMLYGVSDELHQAFVPGRSPDWRDWVADALGVLAGIYVFHLWRARRMRNAPAREAGTART